MHGLLISSARVAKLHAPLSVPFSTRFRPKTRTQSCNSFTVFVIGTEASRSCIGLSKNAAQMACSCQGPLHADAEGSLTAKDKTVAVIDQPHSNEVYGGRPSQRLYVGAQ